MIEFTNGNVLIGNTFVKKRFYVCNNKFTFNKKVEEIEKVISLKGKKVFPSFIAMDLTSISGIDFNSLSSFDDMKNVISFAKTLGITSIYPTIYAEKSDDTNKALRFISTIMPYFPEIEGINLKVEQNEFEKGFDIELFRELIAMAKYEISILSIPKSLINIDEVAAYARKHDIIIDYGEKESSSEFFFLKDNIKNNSDIYSTIKLHTEKLSKELKIKKGLIEEGYYANFMTFDNNKNFELFFFGEKCGD